MKDRESRILAARTAKAALLVVGWLGLAIAAGMPLGAQETARETNSQPGYMVTASLDYREVNYSFVNWSVSATARASAFKKEPIFSGGKLNRGVFQVGGRTGGEVAFAWDRAAGKLYLDLNRNLDLTDDPVAVCVSQTGGPNYYQIFTNIHLPLEKAAGNRSMLVDLTFMDYGSLNVSAAMRSFWQGKVTLQGEEWQVGVLGNPFDSRASLENGSLLLRPWAERNDSFSIHSGSLEAVPFTRKLFVGQHAYELQCTNELQGDTAKVRLQFTEQKPGLGELKITGDFVRRLTLEGGPYLVLLDKPEGMVKVPIGSYGPAKIWLKKGGSEATLDGGAQAAADRIAVNDKRPAVLSAGGPLTNSVFISRQGRNLSLNYQLVGAGGVYRLVNQDRSHPPEFTVYQGEKKIASGKFEFG